jgi:hypothetical protein
VPEEDVDEDDVEEHIVLWPHSDSD